jgi:hypothetical protein
VVLPDPSVEDTKGIAAALPQLMGALSAATSSKFISTDSARKVFLSITEQLGIELDPEVEEELIEEEEAENLAKQQAAGLPAPGAPNMQPAMLDAQARREQATVEQAEERIGKAAEFGEKRETEQEGSERENPGGA